MVVLDATIVNVALPTIRTALHFSYTNLTWVLNAYTLTFGGLLLLGGRAGDILGRRRVFIFGIALFTFASFLGGLATTSWWLLAARALQGVGGAIASPTALSLITTNFEEGEERNRAFGVFAAVSGSGAAIGLARRRHVDVVGFMALGAIRECPDRHLHRQHRASVHQRVREAPRPFRPRRRDHLNARHDMHSSTRFIRASGTAGWGDSLTMLCFAAAAILLVWFLVNEMRSPQPITPLHMFKNRNRSPAPTWSCCCSPRAVRDVLLPHGLRPEHPALQPVEDRVHLPAAQRGDRHQRTDLRKATCEGRPEAVHGGRAQ